MRGIQQTCLVLWLLFTQTIAAIDLDVDDPESIKLAASDVAWSLMSYYQGNESGQVPGLLPRPYYWWEAGAMMGAMVDYWKYTGDDTYNALISEAMQFQVGPYDDYMPPNESSSLGNDDQAFWAMAALSAAETNFPNPPATSPSWLSLAQAVFNEQIGRWDTTLCGGGMRWQIYYISGYNLKNTISNGCLFNIASRLARYTGDGLYAQWAEKVWDWLFAIGLVDDAYNVFDNAEAQDLNCTQVDHNQWTYNAGTLLIGAATMYNYTEGSELWKNRTWGLLNRTLDIYFPDGVMKDICEESNGCDVDQRSFKAYLSRWLAATTQMAPFTYDQIMGNLRSSAVAAAAQCIGTVPGIAAKPGQVCGLKWYLNGTWDGSNGVGQQMAALEVIQGILIQQVQAPVTINTGGTSPSNPTAGHNTSAVPGGIVFEPPLRADVIGGWFITALMILTSLSATWFMTSGVWEGEPDDEVQMNQAQKQLSQRPVLREEKK